MSVSRQGEMGSIRAQNICTETVLTHNCVMSVQPSMVGAHLCRPSLALRKLWGSLRSWIT